MSQDKVLPIERQKHQENLADAKSNVSQKLFSAAYDGLLPGPGQRGHNTHDGAMSAKHDTNQGTAKTEHHQKVDPEKTDKTKHDANHKDADHDGKQADSKDREHQKDKHGKGHGEKAAAPVVDVGALQSLESRLTSAGPVSGLSAALLSQIENLTNTGGQPVSTDAIATITTQVNSAVARSEAAAAALQAKTVRSSTGSSPG